MPLSSSSSSLVLAGVQPEERRPRVLCLCPAFPALSIPTRCVTKSKGGCKTATPIEGGQWEAPWGDTGTATTSQSHSGLILATAKAQTPIPACPVPWKCPEHGCQHTALLPAQLLPNTAPAASRAASLSKPRGHPQLIPSPAQPQQPRTSPGLLPACLGCWEVWMV